MPDPIDPVALLAELDATIEERRRAWGDRVAKGRMTAEDSARRRALLQAVRDDVAAGKAAGGFTWATKLAEVDAELDDRRRFWPDRVAKGRMTEAVANRRVAALEAVRALYWRELLAWEPPAGLVPCWDPGRPEYNTPPAIAYREAVRAHMAQVEQEGRE